MEKLFNIPPHGTFSSVFVSGRADIDVGTTIGERAHHQKSQKTIHKNGYPYRGFVHPVAQNRGHAGIDHNVVVNIL